MKTSELTGAALDWAVAKCESADGRRVQLGGGWNGAYFIERENYPDAGGFHRYTPSINWAQGGPIIERVKGFEFKHWLESNRKGQCQAEIHNYDGDWIAFGPTPLIAAMRCYVAYKLGDDVEIPDELTR